MLVRGTVGGCFNGGKYGRRYCILENTLERISQRLELCSAEESHLVLVAENQNGEVIGYVTVYNLAILVRLYLFMVFCTQGNSDLIVCLKQALPP